MLSNILYLSFYDRIINVAKATYKPKDYTYQLFIMELNTYDTCVSFRSHQSAEKKHDGTVSQPMQRKQWTTKSP